MSNQAPERTSPQKVDPEERRIQAFVTSFGEIRTMDLETDTLFALLDDDPFEPQPTDERVAVDGPD